MPRLACLNCGAEMVYVGNHILTCSAKCAEKVTEVVPVAEPVVQPKIEKPAVKKGKGKK